MITIDLQKILKLIGERVVFSISKTFREGGRPTKWVRSKRTYQKHRSKKDKKLREGKTLIDTGILRRSIHYVVAGSSVNIGTNVVYAKIHNEGGIINKTESVRSHQRKITTSKGTRTITVNAFTRNKSLIIPKREFLLIQPEDERYFEKIIRNEIKEKVGEK